MTGFNFDNLLKLIFILKFKLYFGILPGRLGPWTSVNVYRKELK